MYTLVKRKTDNNNNNNKARHAGRRTRISKLKTKQNYNGRCDCEQKHHRSKTQKLLEQQLFYTVTRIFL